MRFDVDKLLCELASHVRFDSRPWGFMQVMDAPEQGLTVKYLFVYPRSRTSLQKHERKDELIFIVNGQGGYIEADGVQHSETGDSVRLRPGTVHRAVGPLVYLEVSSYDDGTDTIRLEDDYGRA